MKITEYPKSLIDKMFNQKNLVTLKRNKTKQKKMSWG